MPPAPSFDTSRRACAPARTAASASAVDVQVQYVEIYNDSIVDLLAPGAGANAREHAEKLQIREKPTGEVRACRGL
eukprot:137415-Chlamydomonas_euryale.AAC.2